MNTLQVVEEMVFVKNNEVVTDSLVIAEVFGKEHSKVLRDIRTQMDYAGEEFNESNFGLVTYIDKKGEERPKYNLSEEAFTLVAMSYNTKEAVQMKIKFIKEFKRLKEQIQKQAFKPMSAKESMIASMKLTIELNEEVGGMKEDIKQLREDIDKQLTLDYGQQRVIQKLKSKRVYKLWDNEMVDKSVHNSTSKVFGLLGRNLKDAFNVASYRDIAKKDYEEAINFINGWRPMI